MLSFPIESGAFRGDVTCRSKPLLQNGERFEIATEIHTLARFRATLTTPLHGVVFVNPMYPADPVHLNTLIYSRFLFSPTPHSQVLIRDTHMGTFPLLHLLTLPLSLFFFRWGTTGFSLPHRVLFTFPPFYPLPGMLYRTRSCFRTLLMLCHSILLLMVS